MVILSLFLRFTKYLRPHKLQVGICFGLILVATAMSLSLPLFSMVVIDKILLPKDPHFLNLVGIAVLTAIFVNGIAGFLQTLLFVRFKYRLLHRIRLLLFRKIQSLDLDFFIQKQKGYLVSRIHDDAGRLATLLSNLIFRLNVNILTLLLGLAIVFYFDAMLGLMILGTLPIFFWVLARMAGKLRRLNHRLLEDHAIFQAKVQESIEGIRIAKALGIEKEEEDKYRYYLDRFFTTFKSLDIWASYSQLIKVFISSVVVGFILWFGGHQVIAGNLTIGQLAAISTLVGFVFSPLETLYDIVLNLQESGAALQRVFGILDLQPRVRQSEYAIHVDAIRGGFEFHNVGFRYENQRGFALSNISLAVPPGETVGIVGHTGAGKTTLVNLLLRFYDPADGHISLDDVPLVQYTFASLRRNIAVVLQDPFFFEGTLREAISIGLEHVSQQMVERAAQMAQLHERIRQMPQGYESLIGEGGVKLSTGERQRLSIARAMLQDAPILIMDEATSSIDSESEAAIDRAIEHLLPGKTTLIISHRLSTLCKTDRIILLDQGRIADSDTLSNLIENNGQFRALFQAQLDCLSKEANYSSNAQCIATP